MTTLTLELPENVLAALRCAPEDFSDEIRLAAAMTWYEEGKIVSRAHRSYCSYGTASVTRRNVAAGASPWPQTARTGHPEASGRLHAPSASVHLVTEAVLPTNDLPF